MKKIKNVTGILILVCMGSCSGGTQSEIGNVTNDKTLAGIYCSSCHMLPEPGHLTKELWKEHVLPRMGYFLGFYPDTGFRKTLFEKNEGGRIVEQAGVYPKEPILSASDWEKIQNYFISQAPDSFLVTAEPVDKFNTIFETIVPPTRFSPPSTTLIRFRKDGGFYLGDAHTRQFLQLNPDYSIRVAAELEEGAVWVEEHTDHQLVTVMGSFSPTDEPGGLIVRLPKGGSGGASVELQRLQRPVHAVSADLDGDGFRDIVVCEFGKFTGSLSWYQGSANGVYTKNVLWSKPGAIRTYIEDMNGDGKKDIVALFAQADEGIDIYFNKGEGRFERGRVLSFPPSYGSCAFHLNDYNGDGKKDIIYICGDNADFKMLLRPYHGIYLYKNDGNNRFEQEHFYPLNGAYDAIIDDFDKDGDQDIASVSFFPDWVDQPEQGFVFFENTGNFKMKRHSFDQVGSGRWILMDAADYDRDGDTDLVLGSLVMEVQPATGVEAGWIKNGIPFVLLKNKTR